MLRGTARHAGTILMNTKLPKLSNMRASNRIPSSGDTFEFPVKTTDSKSLTKDYVQTLINKAPGITTSEQKAYWEKKLLQFASDAP